MGTSLSFEKVGECLYRNPSSGTYYALLKVRGKQIKRSLTTHDLPEARRRLRDFKSEQERIDPEAGQVTVGALCDRLVAATSRQAVKTLERKTLIIQRIRDRWQDVPARKVKKSDVMVWLASFKFGAASYTLHLLEIRAVFQLAIDDKLIASNPADGIEKRKQAKPIRQTPTLAEFQTIVDNIREQPFSDTRDESADLVEFYGLAGLGRAEAKALTWGDISFKRGQIITFRYKTTAGFFIPIFPQLRPLLEKRYATAQSANGGKTPSPSTKVFTVDDPKKAISGACSRLNLPCYSGRSFRRTFITTAIERGVDVKVIAQWQGHKDGGKLILTTYSHVRPVHSDQMAKLMTTEKLSNVIPMEGVA
ncbi:tyrosine-type recombinase/integrase [Methylacidiphilales bacterium]|nr:tyrosine-type recombinase/integrase [Candidatus Methylacidiphilales bacterium]